MNRSRSDGNEFSLLMAQIARDLLAQPTMQDTLDRIVQLTVEHVPGCDHAGILLMRPGGRVETPAASSQLVRDSDNAQGELGEGPCFDAARDDQNYRVVHMGAEKRWPRYVERARELGIGAMMGFQLFADKESSGALDLYSERPYGLTVDSEEKGWIFASHAGVALKAARQAWRDEPGIA